VFVLWFNVYGSLEEKNHDFHCDVQEMGGQKNCFLLHEPESIFFSWNFQIINLMSNGCKIPSCFSSSNGEHRLGSVQQGSQRSSVHILCRCKEGVDYVI